MRWHKSGSERILDFDIETRKVGFHDAGPWKPVGCEPIAIAWSWMDETSIWTRIAPTHTVREMLNGFRAAWDDAGLVTGHYIRKFDLPVLMGAFMENGLPPLSPKLILDTHSDLIKMGGISKSQENLSAALDVFQDKEHMRDHDWRQAARMTEEGMDAVYRRVVGDVIQHKALYKKLLDKKMLKPPRMWSP